MGSYWRGNVLFGEIPFVSDSKRYTGAVSVEPGFTGGFILGRRGTVMPFGGLVFLMAWVAWMAGACCLTILQDGGASDGVAGGFSSGLVIIGLLDCIYGLAWPADSAIVLKLWFVVQGLIGLLCLAAFTHVAGWWHTRRPRHHGGGDDGIPTIHPERSYYRPNGHAA